MRIVEAWSQSSILVVVLLVFNELSRLQSVVGGESSSCGVRDVVSGVSCNNGLGAEFIARTSL